MNLKRRPQIAIIRGNSLNSWEMQNFAPLADNFDIFAVASYQTAKNLHAIGFPIRLCRTTADYYSRFGLNRGLFSQLKFFKRLNSERLFGLEKVLQGTDLVHTVGISEVFNEQLVKLKDKLGFKIISTIWENIPFLWDGVVSNSSKVHQRKKQAVEAFDHFLCITERAKTALLLEGASDEKITVQPMGIDLKKFKPQERNVNLLTSNNTLKPASPAGGRQTAIGHISPVGRLSSNNSLKAVSSAVTEKDTVVLSIANLTGNKGIRELIFAAARLKQLGLVQKHRLKFIVVGDGEYRLMLEAQISRASIGDFFHLVGRVSYQDIPKIHNLADIFYLGSLPCEIWQEQFGMVLIEAMACGKPVLAAESGSIAEVVGDAGILFPAGDFYQISQEIIQLVENINLRAELGKLGYNRAREQFDSAKVAERIGQVYEKVLNCG